MRPLLKQIAVELLRLQSALARLDVIVRKTRLFLYAFLCSFLAGLGIYLKLTGNFSQINLHSIRQFLATLLYGRGLMHS